MIFIHIPHDFVWVGDPDIETENVYVLLGGQHEPIDWKLHTTITLPVGTDAEFVVSSARQIPNESADPDRFRVSAAVLKQLHAPHRDSAVIGIAHTHRTPPYWPSNRDIQGLPLGALGAVLRPYEPGRRLLQDACWYVSGPIPAGNGLILGTK